jgi:hypothetical protein
MLVLEFLMLLVLADLVVIHTQVTALVAVAF